MSAQLVSWNRATANQPASADVRKAGRAERWLFGVTALASLLFLAIMAWPVVSRRLLIVFDLALFHLPIRAFYSRCLAAGHSFDWMPHMYGGVFLTGEGEHGPYHPLHLLLYRWLPLDVAFPLEVFLPTPLLFAGLFVFLRRYVRPTAALLGALSYTFCSNTMLHTIYPNYQGVMAHLPWLLWLMDTACTAATAPRRRLALIALGVLTGSQLLLGSPQALSYSLFAEGLFAVFLLWHRRPRLAFWLEWLGANALGVMIGAVQLLATHAMLARSTRGQFDPLAGSLAPTQLLQLLAPELLTGQLARFASSEALYFGAVPLLLSLWWLTSGRRRVVPTPAIGGPVDDNAANRLALFALALGVLSAWLALGKYGYLYYLQTCLPLVGQFRLPGRYFTLVSFAAAILAAVAFDRLLAGSAKRPCSWRSLALPWTCVAAALGLAITFWLLYPGENGRGVQRSYWSGPVVLGLSAAALTLAARERRIGGFALVVLAVVDFGVFSVTTPFWGVNVWRGQPTLAQYEAKAETPPRPGEGRWLDGAIEVPHPLLFNQAVVLGYRGGLEPLKRLDYRTLPALRVAHTAWQHLSRFDDPAGLPGLPRRAERWYEVPNPLPRVRLVCRTQISADAAADIQRIDVVTTALVTHPLQLDPGEPGTAALIHEEPGELHVRVDAPGRQLLVLADSYDASWQASVDDRPMSVERVNGDFLGCVVEAGSHEVCLRFLPASIRHGRLLSLAGLGLALLLAGAAGRPALSRSRRGVDGEAPAPRCE